MLKYSFQVQMTPLAFEKPRSSNNSLVTEENDHDHSYIVHVYLPGNSQPNIVRKDGCLVDIIVAMNCIYAINHWNPEARRQRSILDSIHHLDPSLSRCICGWNTLSPTQHTPCPSIITSHIFLICHLHNSKHYYAPYIKQIIHLDEAKKTLLLSIV